MAIRYIVADDLDGTTATIETHHFALDGVEYQIDLSQTNFDRLEAALAPFIAAGRRPHAELVDRGRCRDALNTCQIRDGQQRPFVDALALGVTPTDSCHLGCVVCWASGAGSQR